MYIYVYWCILNYDLNVECNVIEYNNIIIDKLKILKLMMDKTPIFGGPNNPVNRRKFIESEINIREMIIIDNGT